MNVYIKEILAQKGLTQKNITEKIGVTQSNISATISRPSFPTLERIAAALNVEPWQLLAPPSVVDELKRARTARDGVGDCALVGVVRVENEIYTADNVQQLRAIVERLERAEGGTTK